MPTRRTFLTALGATGAGVALGGCDAASDALLDALFPERAGELRPPDSASIDPVSHLLNRVTWGARGEDHHHVQRMGIDAFIDAQLRPETIDDRRSEYRIAEIETLQAPRAELYEFDPRQLLNDLSRARLLRAVHSRRQLFEVMVEFWSDHLNIAVEKGECRWMRFADDREVVRPHALGRFRDLIRASATSPAMLIYLDGHDNRVVHPEDRPNENYARELLELHTLGVHGGYEQRDVMEAARCLSGWTYGHDWRRLRTSAVDFDPARHDDGAKEVLGTRIPAGGGAEDLERLLDVVCGHPSTARHLAGKLCATFISDPAPPAAVAAVADAFTQHDGSIAPTIRVMLLRPEFAEARGRLFKRPLRFVVSALRATDARTDGGAALARRLRRMGHAPFEYPSPDGYPRDASPWMGSLLWRWNFAIDLVRGGIDGTSIDPDELVSRFGDADALIRHVLGRRPSAVESAAFEDLGRDGLALALASPAYQWH